jgi:hypothetical protein
LVEASRRGVISQPQEWFEHYELGVGYEGHGTRLEAISEYQKAVEMSGGDQDAITSLAHAYAVIGRRAEAEKILPDLEQKAKKCLPLPFMRSRRYMRGWAKRIEPSTTGEGPQPEMFGAFVVS